MDIKTNRIIYEEEDVVITNNTNTSSSSLLPNNYIICFITEWFNIEKMIDLWEMVIIYGKSLPERKIIVISILIMMCLFIVYLIRRVKLL